MLLLGVAATLAIASCSGSGTDGGLRGEDSAPTTTAPTTASTVPAPEADTVEELLALDRPVVLAHAGGENAHPHSTPYAYAESVAAGVDVLDLDVQLTGDGVLVVQHDETVDRTTDGTGAVADMTYDELAELDNAHWFTEECTCRDRPEEEYVLRGVRTGEREAPAGYGPTDFVVPRFEDVARRYPDHVLNIEIKGSFPDAVPAARELARLLTELGREDSAVVTSFDDEVAEAFHQAAPDVEITPGLGATTQYVLADTPPADGRRILQIPPEYEGTTVLTPELVERAHQDGLRLWIWPNDAAWEDAEGYTRLLDLGVDGINAADPEVAVRTVSTRVAAGD